MCILASDDAIYNYGFSSYVYSIILIYFLKDNSTKPRPFLLSQNVNAAYHGLKAMIVEVAENSYLLFKRLFTNNITTRRKNYHIN